MKQNEHELKRTTKELSETYEYKEYVNNIIQSMIETLIVITPDNKIKTVNDSTCTLLGYKKEELIGKEIYFLLPEKEIEPFKRSISEEIIKEGKHRNYEMDIRTKDGRVIPVICSCSAIINREGNISEIVYVAKDITDQKRVEEERAVHVLRNEALVKSFGEIVYDWRPLEDKLTWGGQFTRVLGYTPGEMGSNTESWTSRVHPMDIQRVFDEVERATQEHRPCDLEYRFKRNDGSYCWMHDRGETFVDGQGTLVRIIGVFGDITERKKLEEQLRHSQKMETIGQLAGGVAHDFNNIVSAIINYSYLLLNKQDNEEQRHNVKQILASANRAARLTSDLLAFSRKQVLQSLPVKINEVIKKAEKLISRIIGEQINIKTVLTDDNPTIIADSVQIEQVLMNLATNARDAMPEGGALTIETSIVEMDNDYINVHGYGMPGEYTLISITDTGVGMDKKTRERVFEPFYTTKEVGKGTGLGLSIIYGIIKQHNGYINVYSEPGMGTTFKIYLPVTGEKVKEEKSPVSETLIKGTETILLAEDDSQLRIVTKKILEASGYKVIEAVDGEDAVEKFNKNKEKIQLLVFDSVMPKKSGKKAYEEIRKTSPDIIVLFISGYAEDSIVIDGILNNKELNFIPKPVIPNELLKKIRELLNG